ncbi:MAG: hypothetical protein ABI475_03650 [Methylophilaceae bacterium]
MQAVSDGGTLGTGDGGTLGTGEVFAAKAGTPPEHARNITKNDHDRNTRNSRDDFNNHMISSPARCHGVWLQ